jgi:DNA-binding beta-propeller fold protein YncE
MLTCRVPFERENDHTKLWAQLAEPPPRPSDARPGLPPELDAVVLRAMSKDPDDRHPSAGDLARSARSAAGLADTPGSERTVARGAAAPGATTVASHSRIELAGRRRWRGPVLAAGLLILAAGAVALMLLREGDGAGGDPSGSPRPQANAAPEPPRVGATIRDVGFRPVGVAVVNRRVWVISSSRSAIATIGVDSGAPSGPQPRVGLGAAAIARDGDTVWVANRRRRAVLGISARTGKAIHRLDTPLPAIGVAAGPSGLWVVMREAPGAPATLQRFDREGVEPLETIAVPSGISAITLGGGYVWLALERLRRVMRVEPGAEKAEHAGWLSAPANELAYGAGYVWASVRENDSVARIDPRSTLAPETPVGRNPAQLVVARNRVFVASQLDDRVVVLDPRSGEPVGTALRVPGDPYAVAAGAGHLWVTGIGGNTLTRIDL